MFSRLFSTILLGASCAALSAQDGTFNILKGDDIVGHITVGRTIDGSRTSYSMTSLSSFSFILTQEIRSSVSTQYMDGRLIACNSAMRVNDDVRDSSLMMVVNGRTLCFVHPKNYFEGGGGTDWTTARMYYEEPTGQTAIFVESALRDCPLERIAAGEYRLTLPNKNHNHYIYRNGVLQEIRIDRDLFDLVFRRV